MTFSQFKVSLQNHEENEKSCSKGDGGDADGVMSATNGAQKFNKFLVKCFKRGRKGHKSVDCYSIKDANTKWCQRCKSNSHSLNDCKKGTSDAVKAARTEKENYRPEF